MSYPFQYIDLAIVLVLAVVVGAQMIGAVKLYRLYGEISRSAPASLAKQIADLQTDVALLLAALDVRLLTRLRQNDREQAQSIETHQGILNRHESQIEAHEQRIAKLEGEEG